MISPLALLKTISLQLAIDLYCRSKHVDAYLDKDIELVNLADDLQVLTGPELLNEPHKLDTAYGVFKF